MSDYESKQRVEYIAGLRQLADVLESHPEQPLPMDREFTFWAKDVNGDHSDGLDLFAKTFPGKKEKIPWSHAGIYEFWLIARMHGITAVCRSDRDQVCTKRVVGTKKIVTEELDPTWYNSAPKISVEREEEIVEWDCPQILDRPLRGSPMLVDQLERSLAEMPA